MPLLNLLPWRQARKERLQRRFLWLLGGVLSTAMAVLILSHQLLEQRIHLQQERNRYLQAALTALADAPAHLETHTAQYHTAYNTLTALHQRQADHERIVKLLDGLAHHLPEGLFYTQIIRQSNQITLTARADAHSSITRWIRALQNWPERVDLRRLSVQENTHDATHPHTVKVQFNWAEHSAMPPKGSPHRHPPYVP